jgi:hypothetical protein
VVGVIYGFRLETRPEFRYIGLTTSSVRRRSQQHFTRADNGVKNPFYDWLRKVPRDLVFVQPLEVITTTLDDLGAAEVKWIRTLRERGDRLLNLTDGGLGPTGLVWTEAQREAARIRSTGRPGLSRPGMENPFFGGSHSEEQRRRWSQSRKGTSTGEKNPNFGKFGSDHPGFGHTMSMESRTKLSEQRKGEGNPNFGKSPSAETRAKQSASTKGLPRPSSVRSAHTRHHTNKGVVSATCKHCADDGTAGTPTKPEE